MKFYVRELPQKQYHYQSSEINLPKNIIPKPGDTYHDHWSDYHIDRVTYFKDGLTVYATKTELQKRRSSTCYRKKKKYKDNSKIIKGNE